MIIIAVPKEMKNVIVFRKGFNIIVIGNTPLRDCGSNERERLEFLPFFPGSGN